MLTEPVFVLSVLVIIIGPGFAGSLGLLVMRTAKDEDSELVFETRRLFFAAAVLVGLGFLFLESMILHYYGNTTTGPNGAAIEMGREIFDTCKTVLPPIVTLILGFYFGTGVSGRRAKTESEL